MKHFFFYRYLALLALVFSLISSCRESPEGTKAQEVVDRAIAAAGGHLYDGSNLRFRFRDVVYNLEREKGRTVMSRVRETDSGEVTDVWNGRELSRYYRGEQVAVSDSMGNIYGNSINSVFYFAQLPYGLNDPAVNKELLGEKTLAGRPYYKVRVTFEKEGGGKDYEDVYMYWIDKETFKPDYLAYEFHVDGGGLRFREAYNERYVNGIRFVDYRNYRPEGGAELMQLDSLFERKKLQLLSEIRLEDIEVSRDNYN